MKSAKTIFASAVLVLITCSGALAQQSLTGTISKVDEANPAVTHFSPEAEKIDTGGLKSINLNLPAGKYVFICNLPGHYKLGMHATFTVN